MQNKTKKPEKTISLSNLPSIIIAVVLIVGVGAVYGLMGYLFYGIKENITPVIQVSENKSDLDKIEEPVVFEGEEDISDWKVYRNEEFGFEVKYPKNWIIEDKSHDKYPIHSVCFISEEREKSKLLGERVCYCDIQIHLSPSLEYLPRNQDKLPLREWLEQDGIQKFKGEETKISGVMGYVAETISCDSDFPEKNIFLEFEGKQYHIVQNFDNRFSVDENNQILSTFKFIEKDETENWQTYRNEEYGFEFKYPEGWKIKGLPQKNNQTIYFDPPYPGDHAGEPIAFSVVLNINNVSLQEYIKEHVEHASSEDVTSNIQIAGIQGTQRVFYHENLPSAGPSAVVLFANDNKIFIFNATRKKPIFDQILSTFKFIEKDEIVDWKTYGNEEYGFEVKYPGNWDNPLWQENEYRKGITFGCPVFDFEGNEYCPLSLRISEAITKSEAIRNISINIGAYKKEDVIINEGGIPTIKEFTVDTREAITYHDAGICVETYTKIFDSKMTVSFTDRCSVYEGKIFDQILSTFKFIEK